MFIRNSWYVAAWPHELDNHKPVARTLLNEPVVLYRQADGSYTCTGMFREGRFNPDTSFTLTFADKSQFIFCRLVGAPWSGRIGRIADRNGVGLDFTYNASSQLHTVTSQFGQSLTCAYGPTGQLNSITDHTSRHRRP